MPDLVTAFAIGAAVLIGAALISGAVERSPLSFPLLYLALGFALSDRVFDVLELAVVPRNVVHRREAGTAPPTPPCGRR